MTDEEKDLLYKELCARMPYSCKVEYMGDSYHMIGIGFGRVILVKPFMSMTSGSPLFEEVKPYLRPLISMTKEEYIDFNKFSFIEPLNWLPMSYNWMMEHHFDVNGLIDKGLALEAPEDMYKH